MRALAIPLVAGTLLTGATPAFHFRDPRIDEASGLAAGRRSPGVVYVQNDSGDTNRFFAVDPRTGATAATVTVRGATNVDWEDLAVAAEGGRTFVWLADTGDNERRRTEVRLYRVPEPRVAGTDRGRRIVTGPAATWRLRYPDGPADAEALAVLPGGAAYLVTKSLFGRSEVFRVPAHPDAARVQTLRRVATLTLSPHGLDNPFGIAGELMVTGAGVSPDGSRLAIRTYAEAYVWPLDHGDVAAALRRRPAFVKLPRQPQGEGIALPDDRTLLIDSEGVHAAAERLVLPAARAGRPPTPSTAPSTAPSSPPVARRAGRRGLIWLWAGAVGALVAAGLIFAHRRTRDRHSLK